MAATDIRYAVVTGGNQGIGFEICRQLALKGIVVVLTARDEKKGLEAAQRLHHSGLGDRIVFHQLDVTDPGSVDALADFIKSQFGHIDILVNNAGIASAIRDPDAYRAEVEKAKGKVFNVDWGKIIKAETYEMAEECVRINYYGVRRMCEALLPLLQSSNSPRIVNVSSTIGQLKFITNEWATEMLSDAENLTEDRVDEVLNRFLNDFKMGLVRENGWPSVSSAYVLSKAALNAYTRILAKKHPSLHINAVCPGYVSTNLNHYTGTLTPEEGAASIVRLVLLPNGSSSGLFYQGMEEASFT